MKNNAKIIIGVLVVIIAIIVLVIVMNLKKEKPEPIAKKTESLSIVPTMNDTITSDSLWCGTFGLVWNDLKNDYAKQDIVFEPQLEMVNNLNKSDFTTEMLSENSYYKKSGEMTKKLKSEIEKAIKDKFNETSAILDSVEWKDKTDDIILYVMLKKEFEFEKEFDKLENSIFNEKYENIKFFGINESSNDQLGEQIEVLYYNDMEDFGLKINTKQGEEIIIYKSSEMNKFQDAYNMLNEKTNNYKGDSAFGSKDTFKMPELKIASKKEYEELTNKPFKYSNGETHYIEDAIQTVEFEIDNKGGKVKSEALISNMKTAANLSESRNFAVDGTFYLFLKEKDKEKPYLAARIDDITKFQK